ncbi:hypothetical protein QR680_017666 [Steinernema hermaphroditum]|uniref:Uncharacterized protein n=1 Tax=Steinernema hermaphroditum TaxID=289476 RepID=A0AA39LPS9_9BILA|nr:hypothetical protein QR680_017666 [Steinernema hermaphroditum]
MRPAATLAFLAILGSLGDALKIADDLDFNLELIKHQPCTYRKDRAKWDRKLEFEGGTERSGPKLKAREEEGPNCYSIGGKVQVFKEFKGDFSIYLELKSTANKRQVPESCKDQKPDGCGGFGSCLYCNACETFAQNVGVKAELLLNGKQIKCGEGLSPGIYDNLELLFCLPSINNILVSQGFSIETFKTLIQSEDGQSLRSMGIFATVYVFDTDISEKMQTQAKIERVYRQSKPSLFQDEPLPPEVYWSLPFNKMIREQRDFVACHKLYGNVKITPLAPPTVSGRTG